MRARMDIAEEVASLKNLGRDDLMERWRKTYGVSPPKGVRQELMVRAVAWHLRQNVSADTPPIRVVCSGPP